MQIESFGSSLGGYHNLCLVLKIIHNSSTAVGSLDAAHLVGMLRAPSLIYLVGLWFRCFSVEEHHLALIAVCFQILAQVGLCLGALGEDECLAVGSHVMQFGKRLLQGREQSICLGVFLDMLGFVDKLPDGLNLFF